MLHLVRFVVKYFLLAMCLKFWYKHYTQNLHKALLLNEIFNVAAYCCLQWFFMLFNTLFAYFYFVCNAVYEDVYPVILL